MDDLVIRVIFYVMVCLIVAALITEFRHTKA